MVAVDATLKTEQAGGALVALLADAARALTVTDTAVLAKLELVRAAVDTLEALLGGTLGVAGTVALDATTLAALESVTAVGPLTDAQLRAVAVAVTAASLPLPAGAATQTTLASVLAALATVAVTGPLTDAQLRATAVPVSGTVGTGLAQPLTDTQLRAAVVPVSLASTTITGTVATGLAPLTDAQLRATAPSVKDDMTGGECLQEQTGAGAVLTFTFASPVHMIHVEGNGAATDVARVDPFGTVPTATLGFRAADEVPLYLPVVCTTVRVWAPVGMVVTCNGFRRA